MIEAIVIAIIVSAVAFLGSNVSLENTRVEVVEQFLDLITGDGCFTHLPETYHPKSIICPYSIVPE